MKAIKLVFLLLVFSSTAFAQKADVYSSFKVRIKIGCIKTMETFPKNQRLSNYPQVCECIASRHISLAKEDSDKKEGLNRLEWTARYYEANNVIQQKMSSSNDINSGIDFQVADECAN